MPKRTRSPLLSLIALLLVAAPGFVLGMVAGVAWEEPSLLASQLLGETEEVEWGRSVAAGPESQPARAPEAEPLRQPREAEPRELPRVAAPPAPKPPVPAPPPVAKPPPPGPTEPAGRFAVQVGAFGESAGAEKLAQQLRAKGFAVYVTPGAEPTGARWRVRVGPHATREAAEREAVRLQREEKLPTWVLDEDAA